ncbi:MAG: hypothetical protein Q9160_000614 [Pyrenula sp. 1 TL-2023]
MSAALASTAGEASGDGILQPGPSSAGRSSFGHEDLTKRDTLSIERENSGGIKITIPPKLEKVTKASLDTWQRSDKQCHSALMKRDLRSSMLHERADPVDFASALGCIIAGTLYFLQEVKEGSLAQWTSISQTGNGQIGPQSAGAEIVIFQIRQQAQSQLQHMGLDFARGTTLITSAYYFVEQIFEQVYQQWLMDDSGSVSVPLDDVKKDFCERVGDLPAEPGWWGDETTFAKIQDAILKLPHLPPKGQNNRQLLPPPSCDTSTAAINFDTKLFQQIIRGTSEYKSTLCKPAFSPDNYDPLGKSWQITNSVDPFPDWKINFKWDDKPGNCADSCEKIYTSFLLDKKCTPSVSSMAYSGKIEQACGTASYQFEWTKKCPIWPTWLLACGDAKRLPAPA